jgi:RNA polymerase sigma factor (sigma-70 family)
MGPSPDSKRTDVDALYARARAGDQDAWDELWKTCNDKLRRVIRRRLNPPMRSVYDSMDVTSDVWGSLFANRERLNFPTFDALMSFLAEKAREKVIDEYRRQHTKKRDINKRQGLDAVGGQDDDHVPGIASSDPTPSQVAVANEGYERVLSRLNTGEERSALQMKREGYTTQEIAARLGWHIRAVQRLIRNIGDSWHAPGGRP